MENKTEIDGYKKLSRLDQFMHNAPLKTKIAMAAAGGILAVLVGSMTQPAHGAELAPAARTSIEQQITAESMRPMPSVNVDDVKTINGMNARTSQQLRDMNQIATRFHESKAWTGDKFTAEQKAKNIAQAFLISSQIRGDSPEFKSLDGYLVKLRADTPDNRKINNVIADVNFKREVLKDATIELERLAQAVRNNNPSEIEAHRASMATILQDAGYALNANTDWSVKLGNEL